MSDMRIQSAGIHAPQQTPVKEQRTSPAPSESPKKEDAFLPSTEPENSVSNLHEMIKEAREKAEARRDSLQLKSNVRYGDAPMEAYARLARARNTAEVNAASGYARRRIAQFKTAMRQDSENADRIRAAINQLQKAINRAGKKKKDLQREKLVEVRRKKSEQENQRREALRLRQELRHRKTMRVIREAGYIREAEVDNRLQAHLSETRMELRAQAQALSASISPSPDMAATQYSAQAAPVVEGPSAEINLQV